jgi:class 3 adenylate cyclase
VILTDLMKSVDSDVAKRLAASPRVYDVDDFPDVDKLRTGNDWARMQDVVAVVADMKGSTKLGLKRYVNSTIRLYEVATGGGVKVASRFGPDFVDIQGDGFFCLFHGEDAYRQGMAAAMSLAYFSEQIMEPAIMKFTGSDRVLTGLKVGVAAGRLAVGRVGVQGVNELIWPGKPVNWAFKCSGATDRHQVIVTERVFSRIVEPNEFIFRPCYMPHHGHGLRMWASVSVPALPGVKCYARKTPWCPEVADRFCEAVLNGESKQPVGDWQRLRYYTGVLSSHALSTPLPHRSARGRRSLQYTTRINGRWAKSGEHSNPAGFAMCAHRAKRAGYVRRESGYAAH